MWGQMPLGNQFTDRMRKGSLLRLTAAEHNPTQTSILNLESTPSSFSLLVHPGSSRLVLPGLDNAFESQEAGSQMTVVLMQVHFIA